jgi:predicted  nucleic acid-binding Zn-ribbon protein
VSSKNNKIDPLRTQFHRFPPVNIHPQLESWSHWVDLLQKLRLHTHRISYKEIPMETSVSSILQQLRALEELVTHHGMTTEELHRLEHELRTILQRIDSIRTVARDLKHIPKLSAEEIKGLDRLEETLKDSLKKDGGD